MLLYKILNIFVRFGLIYLLLAKNFYKVFSAAPKIMTDFLIQEIVQAVLGNLVSVT